ncbi:hypothetical protein ACFYXF_23910 [Streptomyces sp. NPDC002680]|uniref:hypothetical protein n=1 Tax=Streptomyces sp. NPDC002680 TaxID=3364659 RepID=UPI0036B3FD18
MKHGDGRLHEWEDRWKRLTQLHDRAERSGPHEVQADSPRPESVQAHADFVPPPSSATIQELESAKSDLQDILSSLEAHENRVRDEFRQVLNEQSRVAAELRHLAELLEQERSNKEKLAREVEKLERLRGELGPLRGGPKGPRGSRSRSAPGRTR